MSSVGKRSGRVALTFRETLSLTESVDLTSPSVEALIVSETHEAATIRLVALYRPPKAPKRTDFLRDFADIIDQCSLLSGQMLIEDYNIHWDCSENVTIKNLIDLLDSTNLVHHASEHTPSNGHIIDIVVSPQVDSTVRTTSVRSFLSDNMDTLI